MRMRWLLHMVVLKLPLLLLAPVVLGQTTTPQQFRLNKIEVEGLRKVGKEKVIEACGLKIGQEVDMGALKAAANRLHDSGWFTQVSYRFNYSEGQIDVTFEVDEKVLSTGPVKLGEIEFLGLQQVQRDLALKESGLQPGQLVDRDTIEAAAKRLMATGYFLRATLLPAARLPARRIRIAAGQAGRRLRQEMQERSYGESVRDRRIALRLG